MARTEMGDTLGRPSLIKEVASTKERIYKGWRVGGRFITVYLWTISGRKLFEVNNNLVATELNGS